MEEFSSRCRRKYSVASILTPLDFLYKVFSMTSFFVVRAMNTSTRHATSNNFPHEYQRYDLILNPNI